jgi:hypothetical protein
MNRREIEERLIDRAWQDAAFKQELLSNPKATLEKEGIKLPANIEVRAFEEKPTILYLIIPINMNHKDLSDAELESI